MGKANYEFDAAPLPPDPDAWGRRLRLIVIFIVIATITGGLIYLFFVYGNSSDDSKEVNPPEEKRTAEVASVEESVPKEEETPQSKVVPSSPKVVETLLPDASASEKLSGGESPEKGTAGEADNKAENVTNLPSIIIPEEKWTNPTPEPEKGKPWVGDPPEDGPARVQNSQEVNLSEQIAQGEEMLRIQDFAGALSLAEKALTTPGLVENSLEWRQVVNLLTRANLGEWSSDRHNGRLAVSYTVKSGDTFNKLAAKFATTNDSIKIANHMALNSDILPLGKKLKIYPGPWRIRVDKSARLLKLYNEAEGGSGLYAVFDIGIGRLGRTPSATFVISAKLKDPTWYTPDGRIIKAGDPENMLGDYFLKLASPGTPDKPLLGYGIHGTRDDASVTKSQSNGCIRMRNTEVEVLYRMVPNRTPVEITD